MTSPWPQCAPASFPGSETGELSLAGARLTQILLPNEKTRPEHAIAVALLPPPKEA
ncbi:hypothetical protein PA01_18360 [Azoarcus sp. PA01]|uniref:hypothetical protein n=1 Tax=Aromatoleum aromaticum TaxID=551760 RepID=UPI0003178F1C|nr:hypothetical protein [Aromatoleum aromaticum]KAI5911905.1 hypothetical protein PA01_19990 [Azoarcus sp. PA01]KAI5913749.1 hypothetical protein PA01_18360 [Azoarcus sp. PA01]